MREYWDQIILMAGGGNRGKLCHVKLVNCAQITTMGIL
jgi:hypothetical protein